MHSESRYPRDDEAPVDRFDASDLTVKAWLVDTSRGWRVHYGFLDTFGSLSGVSAGGPGHGQAAGDFAPGH